MNNENLFDGIVDCLYQLLWMKDKNRSDHFFFSFFLPHTIIIKNNEPVAWYFSNRFGQVLRKYESSIKMENILNIFGKNASRSGIVAYYITFIGLKETPDRIETGIPNEEDDIKTMIEYLSFDGLEEFIMSEKKNRYGILQQFIDPFSERNSLIQLIWTPSTCLFSKRANNCNIYDKHLDMALRAATFDGKEALSEEVPFSGSFTSNKISECMNEINTHVRIVSSGKWILRRMLLYLKLDAEERIWLLWCESLRKTSSKHRLDNKETENGFIYKPLRMTLSDSKAFEKSNEFKTLACPSCAVKFERRVMIDCAYSDFDLTSCVDVPISHDYITTSYYNDGRLPVMESRQFYENFYHPPRMKNPIGSIPLIIRRLHPDMTLEQYESESNISSFLKQTALVCLNCYMKFGKHKKMYGDRPLVHESSKIDLFKTGLMKLEKDNNKLLKTKIKIFMAKKNIDFFQNLQKNKLKGQELIADNFARRLSLLEKERLKIESHESSRKRGSSLHSPGTSTNTSDTRFIDTKISLRANTNKSLSNQRFQTPEKLARSASEHHCTPSTQKETPAGASSQRLQALLSQTASSSSKKRAKYLVRLPSFLKQQYFEPYLEDLPGAGNEYSYVLARDRKNDSLLEKTTTQLKKRILETFLINNYTKKPLSGSRANRWTSVSKKKNM